MNQGNSGNQQNRGYEGNYPQQNQGGQAYPSSSNNMQYNYNMNQPYGGNMGNMGGYNEQYYPEQGGYGGYEGDGYEETDYDNLDEIDRELGGNSIDYEAEMLREMESMNSPNYGQKNFQQGHAPNSGPYVPASAVPTQNGKLSSHAHEFWFPECRNCPCCKGFKHGCDCRKTGSDTCRDPACVDGAFESQVSAELATRTNNTTVAAAPAPQAGAAPAGSAPTAAAAATGGDTCKYEKAPGGCRFGAGCRFKHSSPASVGGAHAAAGVGNFSAAPTAGATKCMFFARGNCQYGDNCRFSHF